jgi:hypothetical protein
VSAFARTASRTENPPWPTVEFIRKKQKTRSRHGAGFWVTATINNVARCKRQQSFLSSHLVKSTGSNTSATNMDMTTNTSATNMDMTNPQEPSLLAYLTQNLCMDGPIKKKKEDQMMILILKNRSKFHSKLRGAIKAEESVQLAALKGGDR